jgi:hypothetical protein
MIETTEGVTKPESLPGGYRIRFEPGVHTFPFADIVLRQPTTEDLRDRFNAGDLKAHAWNPQVAERMKQYSPMVIGLDSVPGNYVSSANGDSWIWLPGSPEEMTGRESTYIIGGDLLHYQLLGEFSDESKWGNELNNIGWENVKQYASGTLGAELVGKHIAFPVSLLIAYKILSSRLENDPHKISRRNFLKRGTQGLTVLSILSLLGKLTPWVQSYSPDSRTSDAAQRITDIVKPITKSTWLDGRTALVISKTKEAMEKLDLPPGSEGAVVMGFPHGYEAGNLLNNKTARMEAIRKYAQDFFDLIYPTIPDEIWETVAMGESRELWDSYWDAIQNKRSDPGMYQSVMAKVEAAGKIIKDRSEEWKRSRIMDSLLPFFTATTVYKIKQPTSLQVSNPNEVVKESMEYVKWFPCEEVMEAVSPLGDPERFQLEVKPR